MMGIEKHHLMFVDIESAYPLIKQNHSIVST